jgi:hypothetical protein
MLSLGSGEPDSEEASVSFLGESSWVCCRGPQSRCIPRSMPFTILRASSDTMRVLAQAGTRVHTSVPRCQSITPPSIRRTFSPRPDEGPVTAPISILPPIQCTPWCTDGSGHPGVEEPADQSCHGAAQRIELAPTPAHLSGRAPRHVLLQLHRDVYSGKELSHGVSLERPRVELYSSDSEVVALSINEARALGKLLIQLADVADLA